MEALEFTTEEHGIAGSYPSGTLRQLSGEGFTLRDRNLAMKEYRDQLDRVFTTLESNALNSRGDHSVFMGAKDRAEIRGYVGGLVRAGLSKATPNMTWTQPTQTSLTDKLLNSLWETWKSDEAERS